MLKEKKVAGIILAAGGSSRFGGVKQLLPWGKTNLINTVIGTAKAAGLEPIVVVLGANSEKIRETIEDPDIQIVNNSNWDKGQSTSLKAGVNGINTDVEGVVFLLCDQPQISVNLVCSVVEEGLRTGKVIIPIIDDRRANPVFFPKSCFDLFEKLEGDAGGRQIVSSCSHTTLQWSDEWMAKDIDKPEDYQILRDHFGA